MPGGGKLTDRDREVDVVVIGLGPGGELVAGTLAEAGLVVAGVESRLVGGECPYWGCVPSKMMVRAADLVADAHRAGRLAGPERVKPDWSLVARRIRDEATDGWDDKAAAERFTGQGGILVRGHGQITAPGVVTVTPLPGAGQASDPIVIRARRGIVVSTGTQPAVPPVPGLAGTPFWTNHEAMEAQKLPASLVILGGGAIGAELGQVFARFGCQVTIVEGAGRLIPQEEPEAGEVLGRVFTGEGVTVRTGRQPRQVAYRPGAGFTLMFEGGEELGAEGLLVATGRRVDLAAAGAGVLGIDESLKALPVDASLRVADGVWALGDITGKGAFTHMSMYQGGIVIDNILGRRAARAEYHAVPRVTFTDPEVGAVGLTEAQAREQGVNVRVGMSPRPASARGWIHGAGEDEFVKLVADADSGLLVGATALGPAGGEVLSALTLAVHARVPVSRFRQMIFAYPTFHDGIESALDALD
jgi:pyruvate/2-oxoglutarate dehydrogenase complex dihydrolipoamide dehydrogenase (E3) component